MANLDDITDLRIFPPLGIARFGSAKRPDEVLGEIPDAMDNYDLIDDGTAGPRAIVPAPTLQLGFDPDTREGEISGETTPGKVAFRGAEDRIRPVAPFFEVWARFGDEEEFRPVTRETVGDAPVRWTVTAGNRKASRRTRDENDTVEATVKLWSEENGGVQANHQLMPLKGRSKKYFFPEASIHFGHVLFPRPNAEFPELRLRIYPSEGLIYGHETREFIPPERVVYDPEADGATWHEYVGRQDPFSTEPGGLEQAGWFDDSCDGIVQVTLGEGERFKAWSRFAAGPPDYVPDAFFVRTGLDEFEQMLLGTTLPDEDDRDHLIETTIRTVRSSLETLRQMNADFLNRAASGFWDGRFPDPPFGPRRVDYHRMVSTHAFFLAAVRDLASKDPERFAKAQVDLESLGDELRDYRESFDFSSEKQLRKMPALMRGADRWFVSLTRRQQAIIRRGSRLPPPEPASPTT